MATDIDAPRAVSAHPSVLVVVEPARASAATLLEAVDAALQADVPGLAVCVPLAPGDTRRATLEPLCEADPRLALGADDMRDGHLVVSMPAVARPQPRTIPALVNLVRDERLRQIDVTVPGRIAALARFGISGAGRMRVIAEGSGSGSRRLRPGEVGLRSTASRALPGPPPRGTLEHERAEHLRHRARSATMRARMDRNSQRLYRERLQSRHDRTRHRLAEQRLAATSRGAWVRWRLRNLGRSLGAIPRAARSSLSSARGFIRRARRALGERRRAGGTQAGRQA